jgi:hypothetical protein
MVGVMYKSWVLSNDITKPLRNVSPRIGASEVV